MPNLPHLFVNSSHHLIERGTSNKLREDELLHDEGDNKTYFGSEPCLEKNQSELGLGVRDVGSLVAHLEKPKLPHH